MKKIMSVIDHLSLYAVAIAGLSLVLMLIVETLNVLGRELYVPLPCALEASESLLVLSVFLAVAYVALNWGHTNVIILTMRLPQKVQKLLDAFAHFFAFVVYGILVAGAWIEAFKQTALLEMRIGVFRFPIWPFRILFAVGLTLLVLQSLSNTIKCLSQAQTSKVDATSSEAGMYYG
jgi:TRAP-type C4-dicarboxylate transport system permease small subunit